MSDDGGASASEVRVFEKLASVQPQPVRGEMTGYVERHRRRLTVGRKETTRNRGIAFLFTVFRNRLEPNNRANRVRGPGWRGPKWSSRVGSLSWHPSTSMDRPSAGRSALVFRTSVRPIEGCQSGRRALAAFVGSLRPPWGRPTLVGLKLPLRNLARQNPFAHPADAISAHSTLHSLRT